MLMRRRRRAVQMASCHHVCLFLGHLQKCKPMFYLVIWFDALNENIKKEMMLRIMNKDEKRVNEGPDLYVMSLRSTCEMM